MYLTLWEGNGVPCHTLCCQILLPFVSICHSHRERGYVYRSCFFFMDSTLGAVGRAMPSTKGTTAGFCISSTNGCTGSTCWRRETGLDLGRCGILWLWSSKALSHMLNLNISSPTEVNVNDNDGPNSGHVTFLSLIAWLCQVEFDPVLEWKCDVEIQKQFSVGMTELNIN